MKAALQGLLSRQQNCGGYRPCCCSRASPEGQTCPCRAPGPGSEQA